MDVWKVVAVVVLVAIAGVVLVGAVSSLSSGSDWGQAAFGALGSNAQTADGWETTWSPMSVVTDLVFGSMVPAGVAQLVGGILAAIVGVVASIYLFKLAARILG